jgi:hypothetical protein
MNIPNLPYGNCHLFCLLFKLKNWKLAKWKFVIKKIKGMWIPTSHIIYNNQYKIYYRSRPKGNMTRFWFKGRPQIVDIHRLK